MQKNKNNTKNKKINKTQKKIANKKNIMPFLLVILDGWGLDKPNKGNAISLAKTPTINGLFKKYPNTQLFAHGRHVGLPSSQDGNSEAGHMNMGAGRVVEQDAVKIGKSINEGTFFKNAAFVTAVNHARNNKSTLHLMGMLSNGMSAHSDPDHILALITLARKEGINDVLLHLFTDGRDSPRYVASKLVSDIQRSFKNGERIATIMGRFYAMDRTKKWDRTKIAYEAMVLGKGRIVKRAQDAITESYNKGNSDEFIEPFVISAKKNQKTTINDNDAIIFFNLRTDRARQLAKVFIQEDFHRKNPKAFKRSKVLKNIKFVAMTDVGPDLNSILTAYPSADIKNTLPMVLKDYSQLYLAETEKYAHVTYFFNGGYNRKVDGEQYDMVLSPAVKFYDETPGMSSIKITKKIIDNVCKKNERGKLLEKAKYDFIVVNYAAPDMIGHTGNLEAGIKCVEAIDFEVKKIVREYMNCGGTVVITADHGNIEEMINLETEEVVTEHTSNKVPFIIINDKLKNKIKLKEEGALGDIAPTILEILGIKKPKEMTGTSLIK